jgi:hypothetical protein
MNRWTTTTALGLAALAQARGALAQDAGPTPFAHNYGEIETARSAGLAGAARAIGNGTAGLFLNPASIALNRLYHIEGIFQMTPEAGRYVGGGAIVDSIMNRYGLAGGLAVSYGVLDAGEADWSTFDLRTALAYPISDKLFLGVAPRYASITHALPGLKKDEEARSQLNLHAFTLDAGVTVKPTDSLHISIVGHNVVSNHWGTFPIVVGGGVGYATDLFAVEVDGVADLDSYEGVTARVMGAGEMLAGEHYPIRLGYRYDQGANLHAISAGIGYIGTEFALELSARRTIADPGATTVVLGLAYYVETTGFLKRATEGYEQ